MATFEERYAALNPRQKEAVDAIEGPVLVVAGPGSGKTEILSLRVANILKRTDTSPGSILCLTFTDSAAINMRKRLFGLIGEAAFRVGIQTFHGFSTRVIERFPQHFFEGAQFHPADDVVQIESLRAVFEVLPHDHLLRSFHPEQGFIFLYDVKKRIEELKRSGMTPKAFREILKKNDKEFASIEKILEPLFDKVSKKNFAIYRDVVSSLEKASKDSKSLSRKAARVLALSLDDAEKLDSTAPLSDWKKAWIKKDADGKSIWKDRAYAEKLKGAADIFELYEKALYEKGYFDFGDMIMRVIEKLETTPELQMELEESFQYILVDEFQDTNGAQMRLVELITSSPVHENRPNVMVVGDDDQAVYKFQGAELDNILTFKDMYREPKVITLGDNYRSTKEILDVAEHVVAFNSHRLSSVMPEVTKKLRQANEDLEDGVIRKAILPTPLHEMKFVADEIKKLLGSGVSARDIAVIAREHDELRSLVPFLHDRGVPVSYEKQRNVLHEEHVRELVTIARYIQGRASKDPFSCDHLLPEILRYPFWSVEEKDIWKLAKHAMEGKLTWTEGLASCGVPKLEGIGSFLGALSSRATSETAEFVLDNLVGTLSVAIEDSEEADELPRRLEFKSPFRDFYWSEERLKSHKAEYLSFLSSLRTFIEALRQYKSGAPLSLTDLVEFIDLREKNRLPLLDNSPFVQASDAVTLVTAHKAKGQEFPYVFILSCQDSVWADSSSRNKLPFPANLPLTPESDSAGDFVRIFFVAITRARHTLYLCGYEKEESGKLSLPLRFLGKREGAENGLPSMEDVTPKDEEHIETLELSRRDPNFIPKVKEEKALFEPLLEKYQMSVTHLSNFLDVTRGGPMYFFEQNLLRFPQAKTPPGSFGTALHATLKNIHSYQRREGNLPSSELLNRWFTESLRAERMSPADEKNYLSKGIRALKTYIEARKDSILNSDEVEVSFKHEGVVIEGARLAGNIDKIVQSGNGLTVVDYKTGKAVGEWEGGDAREKLKIQKYSRQLLFYKLLVEGSERYKGRKVEKGVIDFLEPEDGEIISLEREFDPLEVDRLSKLVGAVFKKILALDFPDVSAYSQDKDGVEKFEDDLIAGNI